MNTASRRGEQPFRPADELCMVAAARAGDAVAREQIVDRLACVPAMVRIKHQRMGAPLRFEEIEDVVQNVLMSVWKKLDQFDGRVPLEQWAYGFVPIEILKTIERGRRRRMVVQVGVASPEAESREGGEPTFDMERLAVVVGGLDPTDRQILQGKHFEDLTFDEIAARLKMIANTVKTRYYRCLKRLRESLAEPGGMQ